MYGRKYLKIPSTGPHAGIVYGLISLVSPYLLGALATDPCISENMSRPMIILDLFFGVLIFLYASIQVIAILFFKRKTNNKGKAQKFFIRCVSVLFLFFAYIWIAMVIYSIFFQLKVLGVSICLTAIPTTGY
jgi:hypothetical protein